MEFSNLNQQAPVQKQKLVLTAGLKESLEILQMPLPELQKKVENAVQENPVLEYEEEFQKAARATVKEFFRGGAPYSDRQDGENAGYDPLAGISRKAVFTDSLLEQLSALRINPSTARICRYIVGSLDGRGYLRGGAEQIAQSLRLPASKAEHAVKIVQQLEPAGVGAADLRECLTLQLLRKPDCSPAALKIVGQYLNLLAENKIKTIARNLNISPQEAQKFCNEIRRMNPIPSNGYDTGEADAYVVPEAVVRPDGSGRFVIESSGCFQPRLRVSDYYRKMAEQVDDQDTEKYLKAKIQQATALIRKLACREKTIIRVLEKIIEMQRPCFENGISRLKPMSITDIAKLLGLNESTVSRAIQGKYILYPFGTVALKSFFTSKINAGDGSEAFSSSSVKQEIRILVTQESKSFPLSDQNICDLLNRGGMKISRRTVAKYRDELLIPPAAKRRIYEEDIT